MDKARAFSESKELLTGLMKSTAHGDLQKLTDIVAQHPGEDLNDITEGKGRGLVHISALHGRTQALDFLVAQGCDPRAVDEEGNNIATLATYQEELNFLHHLHSKYPHSLAHCNFKGMNLLHIAAETGNVPLLEYCLQLDFNVNAHSQHGSALELAIMWKKLETAKLLLNSGADPDGTHGASLPPALVMATSMQFTEGLHLLLEHDCDLELTGPDKATALEVAAEFGFWEPLRALVAKGAAV